MKKIILCFVLAIGGFCMAQAASPNAKTKVKVVVDNDFCGDPDGLFQLVHQLLCTTCDIRGIVGGHLRPTPALPIAAIKPRNRVRKHAKCCNSWGGKAP